ncbi:hypothetical protein NE237_018160 [Protea cynaroides]|uniref:Uncharacterized protein n=1 Tax=Protea cynaroides TaxID=273540 RepID=A0A9Q0K9D1_9MAGN|nr:hypothetical protein NE237_018160 [Protea cynaroides]
MSNGIISIPSPLWISLRAFLTNKVYLLPCNGITTKIQTPKAGKSIFTQGKTVDFNHTVTFTRCVDRGKLRFIYGGNAGGRGVRLVQLLIKFSLLAFIVPPPSASSGFLVGVILT